ncbi:MAG: YihY/virulence factor BrkB family protein [Ilumatobacteraceae bacterium]|nr:YihY/virulence factor BrkB family protein [Ilumatobacteraceae bacterium]
MKEMITKLRREITEDGLFDAAASVAFWLLLSLPAALLAVMSSVSLLGPGLAGELEEVFLDFVDRTFTSEAEDLRAAISGLFDQPRAGLLSVSLATAIFTLSGGFAGLIRGLDVAYDIVDPRKFIRLRLAALGLAIGTLVAIAVSTLLWSWSGSFGVPLLLRLLSALVVLVAWAATMFHIGPHHHTPWRYDVPGAIFTAVGWLILSLGFGLYVRVAGSGNELVGATGVALLGLTWMWLACTVLLIGAEINGLIAEQADVVSEHQTWRTRAKSALAEHRDGGNGGGVRDGSGGGTNDEP